MIRAVLKNGTFVPVEPVPEEWSEGREFLVGESPSAMELERIDQWYHDLEELGAAVYEPGEREKLDQIMREADESAKACVRKEMGLDR